MEDRSFIPDEGGHGDSAGKVSVGTVQDGSTVQPLVIKQNGTLQIVTNLSDT